MKNFNLQKNKYKKEGSTMPDYKISANIGEKDNANFVEAGACWIKKDKTGNTFLSCQLSDAYVDHTKNIARKGFELVMEKSNGNDMPDMPEVSADDSAQPPF